MGVAPEENLFQIVNIFLPLLYTLLTHGEFNLFFSLLKSNTVDYFSL